VRTQNMEMLPTLDERNGVGWMQNKAERPTNSEGKQTLDE